jgi:tRNA-2-methylthio-N6-dimethylallyladenosine synthase
MTKTFYIKTFGCQSNKSDSERIAGDYLARGYQETLSWRNASEIVINTCAVRQRAEDRVDGFVRNIVSYFARINSPKPKLILTGCMTHHGQTKLLEILPDIDEILPVGEVGFNSPALRRDKKHGWIPISMGCNSFCTYCIVPYSRGREKSRPFDDIVAEVKRLAEEGYEEITLLGQNVNSFGLEKAGIGYRKLLLSREGFTLDDIPSNQSQYFNPDGVTPFVKLLQAISVFPQIKRIGFITSNPWDFYDDLIDEIATNPKIDRFIHLPIQSGSDKILRLMNRGYTRQNYIDLVNKIRNKIPDASIGTDIIVGFPGETEEDFNETLDLAKTINWSVAFVAQYSPRPGTAAWRLYKDDIHPSEKKRRWEILDDLINKQNLDQRPHIA